MSTDVLEHSHGDLTGLQGFYVVPCGCGERCEGASPMKAEISWARHALGTASLRDARPMRQREVGGASADLPPTCDEPKRLGDLLPPALPVNDRPALTNKHGDVGGSEK